MQEFHATDNLNMENNIDCRKSITKKTLLSSVLKLLGAKTKDVKSASYSLTMLKFSLKTCYILLLTVQSTYVNCKRI